MDHPLFVHIGEGECERLNASPDRTGNGGPP